MDLNRFFPEGRTPFVTWIVALSLWLTGSIGLQAQPDYANAHWNPPACTKYYTSGNGHDFCIIHDMEEYYEAGIATLNSCATNSDVSVFYEIEGLMDASDPAPRGDISQSTREQYYAWHVLCLNTWTFGTEHEGFVSNPAWFTPQLYQASAGLQRHLCRKYGIPMDRNHIVGHNEWQNTNWVNWMAINYPSIDATCNNHTDPGKFWSWDYFMNLITGSNNASGTYWYATNSAGTVGSGTWDNFTTNWCSLVAGSPRGVFVGANDAIFSAGASYAANFTVTLTQTQIVTAIIVNKGNPTFNGGGIAFEGTGAYYTNFVDTGLTATFNTPLTGASAPDKWGAGTAIYNSAASIWGTGYCTLNQGTIAVGNNNALGPNKFIIGEPTGANVVTLRSSGIGSYTLSNYIIIDASSFTLDTGGGLTLSGPMNLGTGTRTATVNNTSTFSGAITNSAALIKAGTGMLTFGGAGANTYGATTVNSGTLALGKSAANVSIPIGGVTVKTGAVLQLNSANQINDGAPMTLSGGAWHTQGFSEQLGILKLTASSSIDLGSAGIVKFAASSGQTWTGSTVLSIANWKGWANGGGPSQLFVGASASGLTAAQLSQIQFVNPAGTTGTFAARMLVTGEIVPVFASPTFSAQPHSQVAVAGDNVTFSAGVNGTSPLGYQWNGLGGSLTGATGSSLTLYNISTGQSGTYSVLVSNLAGTNLSALAQLTVYATAAATLGPVSGMPGNGFSFGIAGVPGYSYVVQSSSNLLDWIPMQTNLSPFTFTDTNAAWVSEFYRAVYAP